MLIDNFDYYLPDELIAQKPAIPAHSSRLLHFQRKNQSINEIPFWKIVDLLGPNDVLVFNNSKVLPARLRFVSNGRLFELLFVKELSERKWQVLAKPAKILRKLKKIEFKELFIEILPEDNDDLMVVKINLEKTELWQFLAEFGLLPLPPYIDGTDEDLYTRYQNFYADKPGSIATPTAGLHFTPEIVEKLGQRGVEIIFVTLHVGVGTFKPVKVRNIDEHLMHQEVYQIDQFAAKALNKAKFHNKRVIAVGTTSCRLLEDNFLRFGRIQSGKFATRIFIHPGKKIQFIDALITNFHLPKSTLLMLVAAFIGLENMKKIYRYAVVKRFRFFSFGDAMFLD